MIEITSETLERVETLLAGVPKGAERALSSAMNRGLSRVKTGALRKAKEVYAVQNSAFNSATNIRINKASTGNLAGFVFFSGYKIPLYKFNASPKMPGTGQQVRAGQFKGSATAFEDAFIAEMRSGHVGIFEREKEERLPIEEIMGSSAAQMIANVNVMERVEKEAQEVVNNRIEHEIDRILNGYGG